MDLPSWIPFQGTVTDTLPGVVPPRERMIALRNLSAAAAKAPPAQKQQTSAQLAAEIRTETDPLIRAEIIRTLGVYPGVEADAILKAAMTDNDVQVRVAACEAWGKHRDEQAVQILAVAMNSDVSSEVRLTAAKALGKTQNPAAVKPLGEALNDKDPAMQYMAVLSLKETTGKDYGNSIERWQQYVKGQNPPTPSFAERIREWY